MRNTFAFAGSSLFLLATLMITAGVGYAGLLGVSQNQHKFSDVFLALRPGDQVSFSNRDVVTHRLVSATPAYELDIGELKPGASKILVFDRKGIVDVSCSMHPEMKMTIFVRTPKHSGDAAVPRATINLLSIP